MWSRFFIKLGACTLLLLMASWTKFNLTAIRNTVCGTDIPFDVAAVSRRVEKNGPNRAF